MGVLFQDDDCDGKGGDEEENGDEGGPETNRPDRSRLLIHGVGHEEPF